MFGDLIVLGGTELESGLISKLKFKLSILYCIMRIDFDD